MEIFGLGDLFKDPTQFGIFKIFEQLMKIPGRMFGNATVGGQPLLGGGGGGDGLSSFITNLIEPYGELGVGSPENAPGEFIPGLSTGGGGSVTDFMTGLIPGAPEQPGAPAPVDNSINVNIGHAGAETYAVIDQIYGAQAEFARPAFRHTPQ